MRQALIPTAMNPSHKSFRAAVWGSFVLLSLIHAAPPLLGALLLRRPLFFNDFSLLLYFNQAARSFFNLYEQVWGYDPHFMAGYPLTFVWQSNVAAQYFGLALPWLDAGSSVKWFAALSTAIAPAAFYAVFRNFDFSRTGAAFGATAALTYFRVGLPALFSFTGMAAACLGSLLSLAAFSALVRLLRRCDGTAAFQLLLFAPLSFLAHKTSLIMFAVPAAAAVIVLRRSLNRASILIIASAAALTLAVNDFWIAPMLHFIGHKTLLDWAPHWRTDDPFRALKDYFTLSKLLSHKTFGPGDGLGGLTVAMTAVQWLLLVSGIAGLRLWSKEGRKNESGLFAAVLLFFFIFSYWGSFHRTLATLNPTRYLANFHYFLSVPAAAFLFRTLKDENSGRRFAAGLSACIVLAGLNVWSVAFNLRCLAVAAEDNAALGPYEAARWIDLNASPSHRVLLEDSGADDRLGPPQKWGRSQAPALFPFWAPREYIGGPYPSVFLKYHQVDFSDGRLLGKPIGSYSANEADALLSFYDVKDIVAWSEPSVGLFRSNPDLFEETSLDVKPFVSFRRKGEADRVVSGSATVRADYGGVYLYDVLPDDEGGVTLSYHYIDTMKTFPPARTKPVFFPYDPEPYLRIVDPPKFLRVVNSYNLGAVRAPIGTSQ